MRVDRAWQVWLHNSVQVLQQIPLRALRAQTAVWRRERERERERAVVSDEDRAVGAACGAARESALRYRLAAPKS